MSLICAQQFYIDNQKNEEANQFVNVEILEKALRDYLPKSELANEAEENSIIEKWIQLVLNVYRKVLFN